MKRCSLLLAMLFAMSALMPAAHVLLHAFETSCEVCSASAGDDPALLAMCDGPCGDPDHHHHFPHNSDRCPTCQSTNASHRLLATQASALLSPQTSPLMPAASQRLTGAADVRIESARAPPNSFVI